MSDVTVLAIQDRAAAATRRTERTAIIGDLVESNRELQVTTAPFACPELADALDVCQRLGLHIRDVGAPASAVDRPTQVIWRHEAYRGIRRRVQHCWTRSTTRTRCWTGTRGCRSCW